jgi:hypothetical protein
MTDGDLGDPHISFSEMWGLPKGRITGYSEVVAVISDFTQNPPRSMSEIAIYRQQWD